MKSGHAHSKTILSLTLASLLLSGCTGFGLTKPEKSPPIESRSAQPVSPEIADPLRLSAQQVQDELQKLNTVTLADAKPKINTVGKTTRSPALNKKISITWVGDVAQASKSVAALIGWHFKEEGTRSPNQPLAKLDEKNKSAFDIIRKIGLQAGRNTGVTIDEVSRTIVVTYLGH